MLYAFLYVIIGVIITLFVIRYCVDAVVYNDGEFVVSELVWYAFLLWPFVIFSLVGIIFKFCFRYCTRRLVGWNVHHRKYLRELNQK